jgi:hypothetical protein
MGRILHSPLPTLQLNHPCSPCNPWFNSFACALCAFSRPFRTPIPTQRRQDAARPAAIKGRMEDGKAGRKVRGMYVRGIILKTHFSILLTVIPLTLPWTVAGARALPCVPFRGNGQPAIHNEVQPQRSAKYASRFRIGTLHCNPSESRISARILGPMDTQLINAKARRRKDAPDSESGFLLCVFAPWRLCVGKSFLSGKSVVQFLPLRLAALCSLRSLRLNPHSVLRAPPRKGGTTDGHG